MACSSVAGDAHGQDPEVAERSMNPRSMQAISSLLQGSASLRPGVGPPPRPLLRRTRIARPWERFTDRARRVLILAQEEALLLNHSFIGPSTSGSARFKRGAASGAPTPHTTARVVLWVLGVWVRRCRMQMPALST